MTARDDIGSHLRLVPPPAKDQADTAAARQARDKELVAALRAGDREVAAAVHDRVRPQIDATLIRLLGRPDTDHDDLAQRALIELFTTIKRFRGDCSLDTLMGTLTARLVYKHL